MRTLKSIISETKDTSELKGLVEVYEELAAEKMQKVRGEIMSVREFYDELSKLSEDVGADFEHVVSFQGKKIAVILIAANSGLYGDIIDKTFSAFIEYIKTNKADVFVIGKTGEDMIKETGQKISYQLISFPDDKIEEKDINELLSKMLGYRKIVLFYGKFRNIAIQLATFRTLSGDTVSKALVNPEELKKIRFHYLYEPSLLHVSDLFANEILESLMEETLREASLAKFASRLMHLDSAIDKIDDSIKTLVSQKRRIQKTVSNKKQNSMITGIMIRT